METVQQIPHNRDCIKCAACEQIGRWKVQAEVESLRQQLTDSQGRKSALMIALKQWLFSVSPKIDYCKDSKVEDWKCYYRDVVVPELHQQLAAKSEELLFVEKELEKKDKVICGMSKLLELAKCPACDGNGSYSAENVFGEQMQIQCQWCYEKSSSPTFNYSCQHKADFESDEQILIEIHEALDGLPLTGKRTGPRSAEYMTAVKQIGALRERAEGITQAETAEQARLINEREAIQTLLRTHMKLDHEGMPIIEMGATPYNYEHDLYIKAWLLLWNEYRPSAKDLKE